MTTEILRVILGGDCELVDNFSFTVNHFSVFEQIHYKNTLI